ncbi:MAG: response regulator [Proteobacteria bacterium]|nr:response regulator [Pseudomonadota bacterium]MBU1388141.1 response regulator [Pseudomonadota bacterium]MBU1542205.1 response regulator [Pseudomonadota bacterium]
MKILLIEDDDIKAADIINFLEKEIDEVSEISRKNSWQSGLLEILDNLIYDFILLDMSMPRYDAEFGVTNEEFEPFAGLELLKEMKRKKISKSVCVITAFDVFGKDESKITAEELNIKLEQEFSGNYKGMVYFSRSLINWKDDLKTIILKEQ